MSAEVELLKKLLGNNQVVNAVEIPTNHRERNLVVDDLEEVLSSFDDGVDYAHFVVRVRRAGQPLPRPLAEPQSPQLSIDSMVNETLAMTERISENRANRQRGLASNPPNISETATAPPEQEYEPAFLLENAKILEENGDYALARNIYQALVKKGTLIPAGLAGMARAYEKEGQSEKAVRCYEEAIAYSSEYPFYQAVAALHVRMGDDEQAAEALLHSLGLPGLQDDQKFEQHKSLGNCFTRLGDYPKAEHHYRKAYELNSRSDSLQVNVGSLALQKGDHDSAQKHFQKALELNASNDKAISGMGMVWMAKQNLSKAHDSFVTSLGLNLNNLGAIYNLVKCAYELKKFNDAAELLSRYIALNPINTNILYSYAGILYHQGEYAGAMHEVKKILESNSAHTGAKELQELLAAKI